jgi:hypothetical protein
MDYPLTTSQRVMYGRVAVGVGVAGLLYTRPPQSAVEWMVAGVGTVVVFLAVDHLVSPNSPLTAMTTGSTAGGRGSGCGCSTKTF